MREERDPVLCQSVINMYRHKNRCRALHEICNTQYSIVDYIILAEHMFVKWFIKAWHWDVTFKLHPNAMRAEIAAGARAAGSCSERSFRKTDRTFGCPVCLLRRTHIRGSPRIEVRHSVSDTAYFTKKRYRKVTIWARVQVASGANLLSPTPSVIPFSTAHWTASA